MCICWCVTEIKYNTDILYCAHQVVSVSKFITVVCWQPLHSMHRKCHYNTDVTHAGIIIIIIIIICQFYLVLMMTHAKCLSIPMLGKLILMMMLAYAS